MRIFNATNAVTFNAATLQLVSRELNLDGCTILGNLNLAQLTTVGDFRLNALPALESTGLTSGITSAESVIISDTGLNTLEGINVVELTVFNVNNNNEIETIDSGLQNVTELLSISHNADQVDVRLDSLREARNVDLQSISSLSVANLTRITGYLSFVDNAIDRIELNRLRTIGNSLTIGRNSDLEEIEFPELTSLGGALVIFDNDGLSSFSGFPELTRVGGSVSMNGSFDNGTFESLNSVSGGFNLRSTGDLTCEEFNDLNSDGDIRGDRYYCSGADRESSSSSSRSGNVNGVSTESPDDEDSGSSSDSSSESSSSEDSGASRVGGILVSLLGAAAAVGVTLY